jgi:hypothetical protein
MNIPDTIVFGTQTAQYATTTYSIVSDAGLTYYAESDGKGAAQVWDVFYYVSDDDDETVRATFNTPAEACVWFTEQDAIRLAAD